MPVGKTLWNRRVVMRDGVALAADVLLPPGDGPFPTVMTRTPYMRVHLLGPHGWGGLVEHGYAYVGVDMRGRGDSEGEFRPFTHDADDGYDTTEWIAAQPWSNGRVGMVGSSYEALTQWWTAKAGPPHLRCIAPMAVGAARPGPRPHADSGVPGVYYLMLLHRLSGRTLQYVYSPSWYDGLGHLPMRDLAERLGIEPTLWNHYVDGEIDYLSEEFALSGEDWRRLDIPALITVGWWDDESTMDTWDAVRRSPGGSHARLLIGPWDHVGNTRPRPVVRGVDTSAGVMDTIAYLERFLARHLKEDGPDLPRCRVFRTGAMRWEEPAEWPAPDAEPRHWYLHGRPAGGDGAGLLSLDAPVAEDARDSFTYDPAEPGGDLSTMDPWGDPPLDRRFLYRREDRLVYRSEPLTEPVDVSGRAELRLSFSSDRPDTDLFAELVDVSPDGGSLALIGANAGRLRLRYRDGAVAEPLTPGTVVTATVRLGWTHHRFLPGHRIQVVVSSSDYPFNARNLNTGGFWADETRADVAHNTVHCGSGDRSSLVLPVQPAAGS
ncbi:CocE/NonD family hydrolase [Streptosporangium sp. NPDC004631]